MFCDKIDEADCVRPIKFKALDEESQRRTTTTTTKTQATTTASENSTHQVEHNLCPRNASNSFRNSLESKLRSRFMRETQANGGGRGVSTLTPPPPPEQFKPNFTLEFSYPAVILEDVCFHVDKSQQQANFMRECIFRLNSTFEYCRSKRGESDENKSQVQILRSVNLNVPSGSIFGLLGPSSCGKTTLLRCLLGLLVPNSGTIRLFGKQTNAGQVGCCGGRSSSKDDCQVPGSNVGYMPQDLGLYEDFTIAQLLTLFGAYMRMERSLIRQRISFMAEFLELPDVNRRVATLSGGQKRRVSFAIACLHMPPLIILDEPTVGVDPLLRRSIWKYLRRLASEENKTIIITTHYIEEAAQADQVALMRAGEILIQDTPKNIMQLNRSKTLEEAFLRICNNVSSPNEESDSARTRPTNKENCNQQATGGFVESETESAMNAGGGGGGDESKIVRELKFKAQEKLALYDKLKCCQEQPQSQHAGQLTNDAREQMHAPHQTSSTGPTCDNETNNLFILPTTTTKTTTINPDHRQSSVLSNELSQGFLESEANQDEQLTSRKRKKIGLLPNRRKFILNERASSKTNCFDVGNARACSNTTLVGDYPNRQSMQIDTFHTRNIIYNNVKRETFFEQTRGNLRLFCALLYKNYRRNVNSIPLLIFQFMLPMIQMITFSLCVGGRPTNIGLGIVNHDLPVSFGGEPNITAALASNVSPSLLSNLSKIYDLTGDKRGDSNNLGQDLYSFGSRYLSFIDKSMLTLKAYDTLPEALADVRRSKLWAVIEIGENFTSSLERRFDLENFYTLDTNTLSQSVIRIYPDRSNKILDMICLRSLVDSYRAFLSSEFDHFRRLPIEMAKPIFDIEPNAISNSIDGYTESIAPGLLASLTYIMAAGLTTFIMVMERSNGILERTYTSGINPISYLIAHALFRSFVMMLQIALVLVLTFYVLGQPIVGSIWTAYAMLMTLNITGISYGLLISSIVTDQNGAALTIVSSLVVKITLSGILWPFEAIPYWLRTICFFQPLTMPVLALKRITLKGAGLGDLSVQLGFIVSITWLLVFLTISARRFKFYQH